MNRNRGIGGSDIGAILGLNPYKKPIDVYMEKIGLTDGPDDNENIWWGREMEPVLRKRYFKETGRDINIPDPDLLPLQGPEPWFLWSPDGLVGNIYQFPNAEGIAEFKTSGYRDPDEWGEPGTDLVPPSYLCQCQWYMAGAGASWADLAVLFMGRRREFVIYHIPRDQEMIDMMLTKARDFWENHILLRIPPEPDESKGWDEYFRLKYPADSGAEVELTPEIFDRVCQYRITQERYKFWEKELISEENHLKAILGDNTTIKGDFGKITWKKNKDSVKIDWEGIARQLGVTEQMIKNFSSPRVGARVFRPWWAKEEK